MFNDVASHNFLSLKIVALKQEGQGGGAKRTAAPPQIFAEVDLLPVDNVVKIKTSSNY